MKSPFPGMDPYLEAHWGDVHTSLVTYARNQLRPQLPADLRARVEEHIAVQVENGDPQGYYPDVRVIERPEGVKGTSSVRAGLAVAEPLLVDIEQEAPTLRSIRIIDSRSGNRVVTAIEVLSPANKCGEDGRSAYRKKQRDLLAGGVNLVEIDLLREGHYMMAAPARVVPQPYLEPYRICVVRAAHPGRAEVYRASLRERLPVIRIPLRPTDADVFLDLQALIDQSYEDSGYEDDIDYRIEPQPRLARDDADWADALLREQGRR